MKTLVRLGAMALIVVVSAFTFHGCDALTKATEIKVNMPIDININVNNSTVPSTQLNSVDVSTNQTFKDNADRIKGADLLSVKLVLTNYTGTPDAATALYSNIHYVLKFDPSYGDNTPYTIGDFNNVRPTDLMGAGQTVTVDNPTLNSILDNLKSRPKFSIQSTYTLSGGATGTITSMNGTATLTFQLTASPL